MKKYLPICIIVLLSVVCLSIYGKEDKKEEFKTNTIKENDNRFTIAVYINGVYSDTMPTESKYFGYVECKDNSGNKLDTLGFVEWENNKWNVRITDITKASTCNVYFINPPVHWLDAEDGTLLKAIKDNNKVENVKTIPGKQINKEDEAILSGTLDDYGTSYYFRGNVQNNYVVFANKCWRIVRITGNGSIKLVLHNNDSTNCNINDNTLNFAKYDGEHYAIAFNGTDETYEKSDGTTGYVYETASGVGYMYGDAAATNYLDAQANLHDSTIFKAIKQWYNLEGTFTNNEKEILVNDILCNNKNLIGGEGYGQKNSLFAPYKRLITEKEPSLVCFNGELSKIDINLNNLNNYKIGLLTADEATFAGGLFGNNNTNYFLKNNYNWWTVSTYRFDTVKKQATLLFIYANGKIDYNYAKEIFMLRPSVALNYNVQVTYDTESANAPGTANNPYIIS